MSNINMLLLKNLFLVRTIPIASHLLSTILIQGITLLIILFSVLLAIFLQAEIPLSAELGLLGGSSDYPLLTLCTIIPIKIYHNADTDKSNILSDLKGKAGVYMWTHKESGRIYIGSAYNLSNRMYNYFSLKLLERNKTVYINNALLLHGYSAFSLAILEFLDITDLSKVEARESILLSEQNYLNLIFEEDNPHTYNILPTAGSRLGAQHSEESKAKMKGENNSMFGILGKGHPRSKKVFVYSFDPQTKEIKLYIILDTCKEAAKFFNCSTRSISDYLDKDKLYKDLWFLYSTEQKFH